MKTSSRSPPSHQLLVFAPYEKFRRLVSYVKLETFIDFMVIVGLLPPLTLKIVYSSLITPTAIKMEQSTSLGLRFFGKSVTDTYKQLERRGKPPSNGVDLKRD